jgi:hypothetical protein
MFFCFWDFYRKKVHSSVNFLESDFLGISDTFTTSKNYYACFFSNQKLQKLPVHIQFYNDFILILFQLYPNMQVDENFGQKI